MSKLAPSLLSADFSILGEEVSIVEKAGAQLLHIDVMDGHFVPNISYGAQVMKSLIGKTKVPFDVHLMVQYPDRYIEDFVTENTEYITVHQEACPHLERTISHIKSLGIKAGVSLNPATSETVLEYVVADVDMVLVMSVNPGFGGQKFIPSAIDKIERLVKMRKDKKLTFEIAVDGGICLENVGQVIDAGADIIVAGSAVFNAEDKKLRTKEFLQIIK